MATLVVLLLIAIAMAVSYATMRSQSTAVRIQHNASLRGSARQAAVTGITVALKRMHTSEWGGVDTSLAGSLNAYQEYQVTFTTGDPSLTPGDSDYDDWPYRVTLLSTGTAADPGDVNRVSTHRIRAVARLVPRRLASEPVDWATMQKYTVYQSNREPFEIDIPCRLEGRIRVQGKLKIAPHYPDDSSAWERYLGDLNKMREAGWPDYRPFNGPIDLPSYEQELKYWIALIFRLDVEVNDTPVKPVASDWTKPTSLTEYQIYAGGPTYTIPTVGAALENVTMGPDPLTNPLGLYYCDGNVAIRDHVTVRGSLFCRGNISVEGLDVHFEPVELPALHGTEAPVRLPVATCQNFLVKSTAGGSLTGFLAVFDELEVGKSPETVEFTVTGRVITRKLFIKERQPWETLNWKEYYEVFLWQLAGGSEGPIVPYFPVWMGSRGRDPQPRLTIVPDSTPVTYHWRNPYDRIYLPHPDDATPLDPENPALRWDLLAWIDSP